jgi:hypothetical protein
MSEAQRQLEEKRAYNRLVSARARQKTKQTISSLETTVETQSKRLHELEQMRSILSEQVRHIAAEKWKIEQAILQAINQDRQGGSARKGPPGLSMVDGLLPGAASAGNASFATSLDANDLLMAVLGEKSMGADSQRRPSATNPPPMIGSPQVSRLALARATADTQQQQLVAASLNDLLLLNNNNNAISVHSAVPHPPTIAPRGSTTILHVGTQAVQPGVGLSPRDQVELAAILQLLQMNRMGRSMNG